MHVYVTISTCFSPWTMKCCSCSTGTILLLTHKGYDQFRFCILVLCYMVSTCRALEAAEEMFPGRTNTDIIFGRPSQTYTSWLTELQKVNNRCVYIVTAEMRQFVFLLVLKVLGVVGNHLSLYQLTVEQGTPLSKAVKMGTMVHMI